MQKKILTKQYTQYANLINHDNNNSNNNINNEINDSPMLAHITKRIFPTKGKQLINYLVT